MSVLPVSESAAGATVPPVDWPLRHLKTDRPPGPQGADPPIMMGIGDGGASPFPDKSESGTVPGDGPRLGACRAARRPHFNTYIRQPELNELMNEHLPSSIRRYHRRHDLRRRLGGRSRHRCTLGLNHQPLAGVLVTA